MEEIHPESIAKELTDFITSTFARAGFSRAVIGVSGGVDSATSCLLAVRALGLANVYPVIMPYGPLSTRATLDGMTFIQGIGIPLSNIARKDIKPAVDAILAGESNMTDIRRGNAMARMRMTVLFDQAKKRNALVMGTENKSEHLLGYYTRFGDEASDVEPLKNLYKTQIYELARYLNVPQVILEKPPSADLWFEQTDEKEFGFTYREADRILFQLIDKSQTTDSIVGMGYDQSVVDKIVKRVNSAVFKTKVPYIAKLG